MFYVLCADLLFVTMGSLASEASETADILRDQGIKAGVIGVRLYRPFPGKELAEAVSAAKGLTVIEKAISYGYEGALATELKAAIFSHDGHRPATFNYIVGLGGKDVKPTDLLEAAEETLKAVSSGGHQKHPRWLGCAV